MSGLGSAGVSSPFPVCSTALYAEGARCHHTGRSFWIFHFSLALVFRFRVRDFFFFFFLDVTVAVCSTVNQWKDGI